MLYTSLLILLYYLFVTYIHLCCLFPSSYICGACSSSSFFFFNDRNGHVMTCLGASYSRITRWTFTRLANAAVTRKICEKKEPLVLQKQVACSFGGPSHCLAVVDWNYMADHNKSRCTQRGKSGC